MAVWGPRQSWPRTPSLRATSWDCRAFLLDASLGAPRPQRAWAPTVPAVGGAGGHHARGFSIAGHSPQLPVTAITLPGRSFLMGT